MDKMHSKFLETCISIPSLCEFMMAKTPLCATTILFVYLLAILDPLTCSHCCKLLLLVTTVDYTESFWLKGAKN